MKKSAFSVVLAVACVAALGSCGNISSGSVAASSTASTASTAVSSTGSANVTNGGKVLNIRCWNTEFEGRFRHYCKDLLTNSQEDDADYDSAVTDKKWAMPDADGNFTMKDGTVVKFVITESKNNAYQNALDNALLGQDQAAADDKVDMFLIEADYALKYVKSSMSVDVQKDIGLTSAELADQYQYTKDIVTDSAGALKGTTWQACPGLFAYRTDIADEVLGTHDPDQVQAKIDTWDKFDAVAAQMKAKSKYMLSGYDDAYRTFSNNISNPLVNAKKEIVIDPMINKWISQTKTYSDNGYNHGTSLWDPTWSADQSSAGSVFGFFYSTWGINFTLAGNAGKKDAADTLYGKYRVCKGPASYYWGGSWISAAKGSDNQSQIKTIMERMTCDKATMKQLTLDTLDYTNNKTAMNEIANDATYGSAFLGGQNHIKLFAQAADKISMKNISAYDQGINENVQNAMKDYFTGAKKKDGTVTTLDDAWANFYTAIKAVYPALKKAA
jgi:multiple sugar transport system substrate-binding protein